ncbi:MAG: DEAD/DEAH box helicase [Kiritimatiellae bacterium]|nr:DEAD/DEAH box helicase [Kiritimatiellia bacterium]
MLQHAVAEAEYVNPTPIQEQSIPHLLEGKDLLGCAQTGTGKTAAFLLPILQRLTDTPKSAETRGPRSLILAPTRELAAQIAENVTTYGKFLGIPFAVVFGGVSQFPQVTALKRGADIVVATPGRLLDLMEQGHLRLDGICEFVLDEADRMLDMGFLPDIRRIIEKLPAERHTQFFSATLSPEIMRLAKSIVKDPVHITISPDQPTVDRINQKLMFVERVDKDKLLVELLTNHPEFDKVLVFARTRHGADKIERKLEQAGISARAIHSDKTQRVRTETMAAFRKGRVRVLVATDIASRGIDVDGITHVINFDLPEETESYVHRIGRTARAGAAGAAFSFVSAEERNLLRAIERMIRKPIEIDKQHAFHSERAEKAAGKVQDGSATNKPAWANKNRPPRERSFRDNSRRERRPSGSSQGRGQSDYRQGVRDDRGGVKDRGQAKQRPPSRGEESSRAGKDRVNTHNRQKPQGALPPPPPWEEREPRQPEKRHSRPEQTPASTGSRWFEKPFQKHSKKIDAPAASKADKRGAKMERPGRFPKPDKKTGGGFKGRPRPGAKRP